MSEIQPDSAETVSLLERVRQGDRQALNVLLSRHQPRVLTFVRMRFDPRLRPRMDASDVVQEAQMEVARRMDDFLRRRPMPFSLWIRKTAYERLLTARRDHLRRDKRSVAREEVLPERSSLLLAGAALHGGFSPSQMLAAREQAERISGAVSLLDELDREILLMRHGEELPYQEIALLLDITPAAARKRYGRALIRLQKVLTDAGILE
jgi:RNA polymerase sigma-70 factor (ECF subfamily)